ncbi:hypothetical protein JB92DRAFT_3106630 [Gautieria morchelliformis]|nr:hypothetical protein JB92DRAFT_3106630 [Gautieria morchelliformis]
MAQTDEAAKKRYARELAAYTLEQWNIARERQLAREKEGKRPEKSQPKVDPFPTTSPANLSKDEATAAAIKAVDYALRNFLRMNNVVRLFLYPCDAYTHYISSSLHATTFPTSPATIRHRFLLDVAMLPLASHPLLATPPVRLYAFGLMYTIQTMLYTLVR